MTKDGKDLFWNCQMIYFLVEKVGGELSKDHCDEREKSFMEMPEWLDIDDLGGRKFHNQLGVKSIDLIKRGLVFKDKMPN